jgi:hypothetical protein
MSPRIFYRVEDADSASIYIAGKGIYAGNQTIRISFWSPWKILAPALLEHLDWGSPEPSPFISMYEDEDTACREAERRVKTGKEDVRMYMIIMSASEERVEYRHVGRLADKLGVDIPKVALHNSIYEWICLKRIPDDAVIYVKPF